MTRASTKTAERDKLERSRAVAAVRALASLFAGLHAGAKEFGSRRRNRQRKLDRQQLEQRIEHAGAKLARAAAEGRIGKSHPGMNPDAKPPVKPKPKGPRRPYAQR